MVQTAREALCNTPRVALQSEFNPLGMKVLLQQTAEYLANLAERELLPDDHRTPRLDVASEQIRQLERRRESPPRIRNYPPSAANP